LLCKLNHEWGRRCPRAPFGRTWLFGFGPGLTEADTRAKLAASDKKKA
jgi:hypothetical protein